MTNTKKIVLGGLTALAAVAAPIATVVSCGSSSEGEMDSTIVIQAEKEWTSAYKTIISDFEKSDTGKKLMKDNGIDKIKVQEMGSFDVEPQFQNKGINDATTPDIFLFANDKFDFYRSNKYLKAFNEKTADEFLNNHAKGEKFVAGTSANISQSKMYGIPENVEAMIKLYDEKNKDVSKLKTVTKYGNLWMSAGYFNLTAEQGKSKDAKIYGSDGFNLRDIVYTGDNGKFLSVLNDDKYKKDTIATKAEAKAAIESGFKNILTKIKELPNGLPADALVGKTENDEVNKFFTKNIDKLSTFDGPWAISALEKDSKSTIKAEAPTTTDAWTQWGGGWSYGMNARVSDGKAKVMEALIGQFYNDKYAELLFKEAGKVSPTESGKAKLTTKDYITKTSTVPQAIYKTSVLPKPVDGAFNSAGVWTVYSNLMSAKASQITAGKITSKELSNEFINNLTKSIANANAKNGR
ncbi:hypothetical protein MYMA111404_01960 [Mycoplasma marinum]|uniref:Sugar ABC transporter substrate-binding protein n=1 Tax=Mycoplasma marinum TaxID=1937190 RepID=A0A4R0XTS6_9MOLU|nr:hypothetical protein [Mycoplasma marinum]TCG11916.1 hypothetical protein C4B24_00775 [Mycoplasma marinum]